MSDLRLRVISAVSLGIAVLAATYFDGWLFALVSTALAMMVWSEWVDMTCPNGDDRIRPLGILLLGIFFVLAVFLPNAWLLAVWLLLSVVMALGVYRLAGGKWAILGFLYASAAMVAVVMLRQSPGFGSGFAAIIFLFATVWATDIGAYFVGRRVGGPKVAPRISPNKTWSGAIGGVISAVVAGVLVFAIAGLDAFGTAVTLGVVISVVSQVGDFFESWVKRRNGVKDSSRMIPGHGGVMDRVDGLIAASVVLWLISMFAAGPKAPSIAFFL